jgi:hypothetical protein
MCSSNNLRLSCPLPHPPCWDARTTWTKSERERIVAERKAWCEKCERRPKAEPIQPVAETIMPKHESQKPISEMPVAPEEVERIAERMKICIGCEKANYTKVDPQPEAAAFIPRTLRLAFTRAEYIHGVQGLTCKDRPGCCELSKAMMVGGCEIWNAE